MQPAHDTHGPTTRSPGCHAPRPKHIDEDAPVVARAQIEVLAPIETVFARITDIAAWPSWNPAVRAAAIDGPLAIGSRFRWRAGPSTIVSTLEHIEPPLRIVWTGRTFGIRAIHAYQLASRDGRTLVTTEESWDGVLPRLFGTRLARALQESLESGLQHLREAAGKA